LKREKTNLIHSGLVNLVFIRLLNLDAFDVVDVLISRVPVSRGRAGSIQRIREEELLLKEDVVLGELVTEVGEQVRLLERLAVYAEGTLRYDRRTVHEVLQTTL